MDYEITYDTQAIIPLDQNNTKVLETDNEYFISENSLSIMEHSCEYFGSSYKGRKEGTKKLLGITHKAPIIIEESRKIIFFPTKSPEKDECIWINLEKIDNKTYTMICKIVGIVFDNAIEATLSSKKKQLLFDVYEENNDIIIDIEISFNNTVYIEKISNKNYSTKGKNRGLGLYIVKKMINSNKKLSLEQKIDKDIFITKLCIKNLAEKLS